MTNFKKTEPILRKLALIQTRIPDNRVSLQYLTYLANLNKYQHYSFKPMVLELHIVNQLFAELNSKKVEAVWRDKFEVVMFEYFEKRLGKDAPPTVIMDAYRYRKTT